MIIQSTMQIVYYPAPQGRTTILPGGTRRIRCLRTAVVVDRKGLKVKPS
jgi:hypothetical protein